MLECRAHWGGAEAVNRAASCGLRDGPGFTRGGICEPARPGHDKLYFPGGIEVTAGAVSETPRHFNCSKGDQKVFAMADRPPIATAPLKPTSSVAAAALIPQGAQAGKPSMPLGRPFTLIGSRNRAHLHLLSSSVSRNHACVISTDNGLYLRDLASRTGVLVNGRKVKEADLRDGDKIQVGSFKFTFTDPAGPNRFPITPKAAPAMLEMDGHTLTPVDGRTLLIGSRAICDITIEEAAVSNTHALIFEVNGHRFIRDLGSRTGTLLNGKPVHHQPLEFGDQIRIGETTFQYVSGADVADDQRIFLEDQHETAEPGGAQVEDTPSAPRRVGPAEATTEELLGPQPLPVEAVHPETMDGAEPQILPAVHDIDGAKEPEVEPLEFATAEPDPLPPIPLIEPPVATDLPLPEEHAFTAPLDVSETAESANLDFSAPEAEAPPGTYPAIEEAQVAEDVASSAPPIPLEPSEPTDLSITPEVAEPAETEVKSEPVLAEPPAPAIAQTPGTDREPTIELAASDKSADFDAGKIEQFVELPPITDAPHADELDTPAVRFDDRPLPVEDSRQEPMDEAPPVPTPVPQVVTETPAPPELATVTPEELEQKVPARRKRQKGRRTKAKSRKIIPQESPTESKTAPDSVTTSPPAQPPADVSEPEVPSAIQEKSDADAAAAEVTVAGDVVEVVAQTDPTPESALAVEPALEAAEPIAALPAAEPFTDAAISDTEFDQAVEDFAGPELGPLVEESTAAPIAAEQDAQFEAAIAAESAPALPEEPELQDPSLDVAVPDSLSTSQTAPPEQTLTAGLPLEDSLELDPALLSPMEPVDAGDSIEAALDLEPVSEPEILDAQISSADDPLAPSLSLDELPPLGESRMEQPAPTAEAVSFTAEPPLMEDASNETALEPPPAAPPSPVHPFFGMERDSGSFLGGIPLSFTAKLPPPPADEPPPAPPQETPPASVVEPEATDKPLVSTGLADVGASTSTEPEALTFPDEPDPIPALDIDLNSVEEPLELFDETSHKLDALPEALESLPDVSEALASPQESTNNPGSGANGPGAPPPQGAQPAPPVSPPRPKFTPPPPPKTSPLRSYTTGPAVVRAPQTPGMEADDPPFAGANPVRPSQSARGLDGLAVPPVRETDVFSHTAFPAFDEAIFGPPVREIPAIPRAGGAATEPPPVGLAALSLGAGTDIPAAAVPPTSKTARERKREAIPPNRQSALRRPPGQTAAAPVPAAEPTPPVPRRRPWWKNIKILLPLLFVAMILAAAAILFFVNPHNLVRGTLQIDGLKELTVFDRKQQLRDLRAVMLDPAARQDAAENLKNQNPGVAPGFLLDPSAIDELSQPANSSLDEASSSLVLWRQTTDADGDKLRMKALLSVVFERYKSRQDGAATARAEYEQARTRVREGESRKTDADAQVHKLTDEVNSLAGQGARDLLLDLDAAVKSLQEKDEQLRRAWDEAAAVVGRRESELSQAQLAGAPSGQPSTPESDATIKQVRQSLATVQTRLEAARLARDGTGEQAAVLFRQALEQLEQQVASLPAPQGNTKLGDYLGRVRESERSVRGLDDRLVVRRQQDQQTVNQLRKQLADRRQSYRQQVWDRDEKLRELSEEQDAQSHRFQAAANSGYAQEAAKIQGVLDDLDEKIRARRAALDTGQQQPQDLQQMQDAIARIEKDALADNQQMRERLKALETATHDAPGEAGDAATALGGNAAALTTAFDRYAGAVALSPGSAADEIKALEAQVTEQQSKLDARQQDLANAAAARLATDQARKASIDAARQAVSAAQDAQQKASAAYTANSSLLVVCRELNDARGNAGKTAEELDAARRDLASRQAQLDRNIVIHPPDDTSVAFLYGHDERIGYLVGALLAVVLIFAGPLWISLSRQEEPEPPYAAAMAVAHEVPGHSPDEYASTDEIEHHEEPAVA